ncbi:hypothetical protein LCGC14_2502520 [marine sediment metagenome]|uniref:Uncharacterized protein n=1 Tax=marine sediment metagenome TaxID=412755 RepID=A0A0F9B296_9ZZZZ
MGLLDDVWGSLKQEWDRNPYPGLLSDDMAKMYKQQQLQQILAKAGDFLTRRAQGDRSATLGGQGGQGGGQGGLPGMMKMQQYQQGQQAEQVSQQKDARWAEQFGGTDPTSGITWDQGRPGAAPPGVSPRQSQALGLLGREKGEGLLAAQAFRKPDTLSSEAEAQKIRMAQASRAPEKSPVPKGLGPGEAYNALLEEKAYQDAGETVPAGVAQRARVARHVLQTKQYRTTPAGDVVSSVPGVPTGFGAPSQAAPGQAAPRPGPVAPTVARGLTTEISAKPKVDVSLPVSTIRKISELLNDPGGETITGVVGTAKRLGGGLARQAGIPVSERAERLQRLLETLQGQMGPIILNEKRLSETERARLERIVGNVSPTMDEHALRSALADLVDFIVSVEER